MPLDIAGPAFVVVTGEEYAPGRHRITHDGRAEDELGQRLLVGAAAEPCRSRLVHEREDRVGIGNVDFCELEARQPGRRHDLVDWVADERRRLTVLAEDVSTSAVAGEGKRRRRPGGDR